MKMAHTMPSKSSNRRHRRHWKA